MAEYWISKSTLRTQHDKRFLNKNVAVAYAQGMANKLGKNVHVMGGDKDIKTYAPMSKWYFKYIIGCNPTFVLDMADTIVVARKKCVAIMKENDLGMCCIYDYKENDVGTIITNGSRWEYHSGKKSYTLNPRTGTIGKY